MKATLLFIYPEVLCMYWYLLNFFIHGGVLEAEFPTFPKSKQLAGNRLISIFQPYFPTQNVRKPPRH